MNRRLEPVDDLLKARRKYKGKTLKAVKPSKHPTYLMLPQELDRLTGKEYSRRQSGLRFLPQYLSTLPEAFLLKARRRSVF